jgi:predicted RNA-binding Zn-ribbon protein involved in translation (DUF1610 family)
MSADYIRLAEPPMWCIQYPTCSACAIDLFLDGDTWLCPSCGTTWDGRANDGDTGTLYRDWAGEEPSGPVVASGDAWQWGDYRERLERHRSLPEFCPKPTPPRVVT